MVTAWCHFLRFPKILVLKADIEEHRTLQTALYAF